ncbi:hypothetical protein [Photobacterium sanguinicancri]|uniref:hypothetical protein n=1 Tax=Photobacterium sanguinicancri TaxID=875932 RepID=UPI0026E1BACF|nr:hypothetical protein [Photobacterium sanguinicancri]MDO6496911.1 hypothetical protein [Photobacterium sanguinicancri]
MQTHIAPDLLLTPESANQLRKDFTIEKAYLIKPKVIESVTDNQLTIATVGMFSFLSFILIFFLIAETVRSFNGTS